MSAMTNDRFPNRLDVSVVFGLYIQKIKFFTKVHEPIKFFNLVFAFEVSQFLVTLAAFRALG